MKRLSITLAISIAVLLAAVFYLNAESKARTYRVSEVLDTNEPYTLIAVIPNVASFVHKLREGEAIRAFFDSPLGLHFLRSAPTRAAAHLHRLLNSTPKSWRWNLYAWLVDGPVFYRSYGKQFALVLRLNKKGKLLSSLVNIGNATQTGDWLVVASDKATLQAQLAYLKNPNGKNLDIDAYLQNDALLALSIGKYEISEKTKSLSRALIKRAFGADSFSLCNFRIRPAENTIALDGDCPWSNGAAKTADEAITVEGFPAYAYFKTKSANHASVIAFGGFSLEYGNLIPRLLYSAPVSEQKALEFFTQAFKSKRHQLEAKPNTLLIKYPLAYAYGDKKFELFAPELKVDRERFYWNSYTLAENKPPHTIQVNGEYQFFMSVRLYELWKNSQAALGQFDAIYSSGHFNEFRDALAKSAPTLKRANVKLYARPEGSRLQIAGALNFAQE